jgi:hypothetical protein
MGEWRFSFSLFDVNRCAISPRADCNIINNYTTKVYGGVEVQINVFSTSALIQGE